MRLLFLGNANSPLINNLARELRKHNSEFIIDIISDSKIEHEGVKESFDEVIELDNSKWFRKAKFVRILGHFWQCRSALQCVNQRGYDHIHIFFLYPSYGILSRRVRKMTSSIIVSVFGSEYYLTSSMEKWLQGRIARVADKVVASNKNTLRDFSLHYGVPENKQHIRLFGLKALDYIETVVDGDRSLFKGRLGIPSDKIVVTCGYNGSRNQNHLKIIAALSDSKFEFKKFIFLLVPMTIGGNQNYRDEVRRALMKSGFSFMLLDKFLSTEQVALVREATEVMIQLQNSDQLSGAMLEHLYAENIVITGSWLPYDFLDEHGLFYYQVDRIEDVGNRLIEVIAEKDSSLNKRMRNRDVIWLYCGWPNAQANWSILYRN